MKKEEQRKINQIVENAIEKFNQSGGISGKGKRLRYSSAYVFENDKYYVLRSYRTIIAIIDKSTDTLYDFLRLVWGYSASSAKHVSKFSSDYGKGFYRCTNEYRYYHV